LISSKIYLICKYHYFACSQESKRDVKTSFQNYDLYHFPYKSQYIETEHRQSLGPLSSGEIPFPQGGTSGDRFLRELRGVAIVD